MVQRILFVCTGNTCRSPMAEALLRKMAKERGIMLEVRSAGVAAIDGQSISRHAEDLLRDYDIHEPLRSSALSAEMISWADLVLTLTQGHKQHVLRNHSHAADKIYTLKEYTQNDESVKREQQELDELYAQWQLQRSLGQEMDAKLQQRMIELQQRMPSYDISDPYGGSRDDYEVAAAEIRAALGRLLDKLAAPKHP